MDLTIKEIVQSFRILRNKGGVKVLKLIIEQKGITVTELYIKSKLEQSPVSQILAKLKKSKLVFMEKDGKYRRYTASEHAEDFLDAYLNNIKLKIKL